MHKGCLEFDDINQVRWKAQHIEQFPYRSGLLWLGLVYLTGGHDIHCEITTQKVHAIPKSREVSEILFLALASKPSL